MARPRRREYANAIYHVINRGNYRSDIFGSVGAAQAFVSVLEEATTRFGWTLGAYVVMRNHYHLAVQTPEPNLSIGMQWLQVTFATRFNRLRDERGHLFQGRYQAICLEDEGIWARVADYIHLNPVRARVVTMEQLGQFRWSSLARFLRGPRWPNLQATPWLTTLGIEDQPSGWLAYQRYLEERTAVDSKTAAEDRQELSRGWAVGSPSWKQELAAEPNLSASSGDAVEHREPREIREAGWAAQLRQMLIESGHATGELENSRKNARWKLEIADELQRKHGASVVWLAAALQLGKPATARGYLWKYRQKN